MFEPSGGTALGAAWLAGSYVGVWPNAVAFAKTWARERRFEPHMDARLRKVRIAKWHDAVKRTLS